MRIDLQQKVKTSYLITEHLVCSTSSFPDSAVEAQAVRKYRPYE